MEELEEIETGWYAAWVAIENNDDPFAIFKSLIITEPGLERYLPITLGPIVGESALHNHKRQNQHGKDKKGINCLTTVTHLN